MSKSQSNQHDAEGINNQAKRLRFHPYYYMNRKGIYKDKNNQRHQIKIVKFQKSYNKLEIKFQERKRNGQRFVQSLTWEEINFDYYIISGKNWSIKFSKNQ